MSDHPYAPNYVQICKANAMRAFCSFVNAYYNYALWGRLVELSPNRHRTNAVRSQSIFLGAARFWSDLCRYWTNELERAVGAAILDIVRHQEVNPPPNALEEAIDLWVQVPPDGALGSPDDGIDDGANPEIMELD